MRVQLQQNKKLNNTNNSVRTEDSVGRISKPFPIHIFPTIISWYIYEILVITHKQFYMSGEGESACKTCPETQQVVHLNWNYRLLATNKMGRLSLLLSRNAHHTEHIKLVSCLWRFRDFFIQRMGLTSTEE